MTARWYADAPREPEKCWRRGLVSNLCNRPTYNRLEVCDYHLAEMRGWATGEIVQPPAPADPIPDTPPPAAARVWLDELSDQLEDAIAFVRRRAA